MGLITSVGFPEVIPPVFYDETKSIAVVGDLQLTSWLEHHFFLFKRDFTDREQELLIAHLRSKLDEIGLLVIVGDLVFNSWSNREWSRFDALLGPIARKIPILPALGNHDYPCILGVVCTKIWIPARIEARFPWFSPGKPYAVDYAGVRLLFFDSETKLAKQGEWLEAQLEVDPIDWTGGGRC